MQKVLSVLLQVVLIGIVFAVCAAAGIIIYFKVIEPPIVYHGVRTTRWVQPTSDTDTVDDPNPNGTPTIELDADGGDLEGDLDSKQLDKLITRKGEK